MRKISINECSKKTGIPYGALYPLVHGKVALENCQYSTLLKLSNFLGYEVEDLFSKFEDFSVYWMNEKTADVNFLKTGVKIERYTTNPAKQIFYKDSMSLYELGDLLTWRCWDKKRENIEKYLYSLGLTDFNPYEICKKTHGVMFQDKIWFKYSGENLTWENVKCN